jgi:hypothetical protein
MRMMVRSSTISRLFRGVVAAVWLCASGSAWAGDGANLQTIQKIIGPPDGSDGFCKILNMKPCPQLPTVTQALLEAAGLGLSPPEMVAAQNSIPPGSNVFAGNPAVPLIQGAATPFPLTSPMLFDATTGSGLLSTLTPLAFISSSRTPLKFIGSEENNPTTAAVTQLYDHDADTFLYGVTASLFGFAATPGGTIPDTLLLFYDQLERTNRNFPTGQTVAKFQLPLTVLNSNGTETPLSATLQFKAPAAGKAPCSASTVVSTLWPTGIGPDQIGLNCAVVFGPSPTSTHTHAVFEVAVPLLVTGICPTTVGCSPPFTVPLNTDPAYFYSVLNHDPTTRDALPGPINKGLFTAFAMFDDYALPLSPNLLGANGVAIGIAPTAGPLGPPPSCTGTNCTPPPSNFALCASLQSNGYGHALLPAVGAYYAIATDGETLLSAALPGVSTSVCPRL